ncbi:MAG: hybrid sensor histidine kinase/response regulator [Deltaproteobacteria bacterium]|nr:MAG: hybrid sensor histidine kinase/response regulator [Deltaproteobacteria bacterium]
MQRQRILIVDDDEVVRESLVDELGDLFAVDAAASGEEAVEKLARTQYDAVISDLRMPGMDGIEVLDRAKELNPDVIRILLTGYLDDKARVATTRPDAPFKVAKPWHDALEVTLRRAFEFRDTRRRLASTVADALAVAGISDELAGADGYEEAATILVRRMRQVEGVLGCEVWIDVAGASRRLAGALPDSDEHDADWAVDEPIAADQSVRVRAVGQGDLAKEIALFLVKQAQRWATEDRATRLARRAASNASARARLTDVSRRATLGAMTASLVHELASLVLCLQASQFELEDMRDDLAAFPDVLRALDDMDHTTRRIRDLFEAMRRFVRSQNVGHRRCDVAELVQSSIALTKGYTRSRATVRHGELPAVSLEVNEPLFLQVLVNLIRNAADVSPQGGFIDVDVVDSDDSVEISVTDDGPGVPEEHIPNLFEPFFTTKADDIGSGLGLAISAEIVQDHGGELRYERAEGRGARFVVSLPKVVA